MNIYYVDNNGQLRELFTTDWQHYTQGGIDSLNLHPTSAGAVTASCIAGNNVSVFLVDQGSPSLITEAHFDGQEWGTKIVH